MGGWNADSSARDDFVRASPTGKRMVLFANRYLERLPLPSTKAVVYGGSTLWGLAFGIVSIVRYARYGDRRYDLGNFTQAVWSTAHGHFLEVTEVGGAQVSRLGIHVDPIIALFAPLWWVWPSPALLLTVQALALAAGAAPLFWLARKHLRRERDAAFIAVAYLLCPSITSNALFEFHAVALCVPLLLLAIWFLDEERPVAFAIAATAAALCQEQIGLVIAGLGVGYAIYRNRPFVGAVVAAAGLAASVFDFAFVLHHYSHGSPFVGRFAAVGGSPRAILVNLFTDPSRVARAVQVSDVAGAVLVLLPVLGLCLATPLMVAAVPQAALLTLSANTSDWRPTAQNVLPIIPFVYAGAAIVLGRRERRQGRRLRVRAEHVLTVAVAVAIAFGPTPLSASSEPGARLSAARDAAALIPKDAPVAATNHLGSHLAARRYVYVFPVIDRANWIAIDTADAFLPAGRLLDRRTGVTVGAHDLYWQPRLLVRAIRLLQRNNAWREIYARSTVHVFVRRHPHPASKTRPPPTAAARP